ncbi:7641_t:CDS:2, partial [Racocetra persica]
SLDPIYPKLNTTIPIVKTLPFGGYALITRTANSGKTYDFAFDLYDEYDKLTDYNFPLKPIVGNAYGAFDILNNNKMIVAQNETTTSWSLLSIEIPPLSHYNDTGYNNLHVNTTYPRIGVSNLEVNSLRISITYQDSITLNDGNLYIYQNIGGTKMLRQLINASTCTQCNVSGNVITIDVLSCTFSDPIGSYYIEVDNNFIKSLEYNESILGIYPNIWTFKTDDLSYRPCAGDIYGTLRLTINGTNYFLDDDEKHKFFDTLINELTERIPTKKGRLSTTAHYQFDTSDSSKVIIPLFISETRNDNDKMTATYIWENLDLLIKNKEYTNILTGSTTVNLDETYGYRRTTFSGALGVSKRAKARAKKQVEETGNKTEYEESETFIILQLGIALFRFGTFTAFVVIDSKAIPHFFIPSVAFLVIPTVINLFIAFGILFSDQSQNDDKVNEKGDVKGNEKSYQNDSKEDDKNNEYEYVTWFAKHRRVAVTIALLSGINIDVMLMLKSCLAGFNMFNAPFNDRSLKIIFWGACADIFLSDIPQFVIQ